jgi:glyoxylase-like metal-dependent hydrolase (beta-lactamase superfamily II)
LRVKWKSFCRRMISYRFPLISRAIGAAMTKAKAVIVPVMPFQQNCTLLWCEATKRAVVIDPGGDLPEVERAITRAGVT